MSTQHPKTTVSTTKNAGVTPKTPDTRARANFNKPSSLHVGGFLLCMDRSMRSEGHDCAAILGAIRYIVMPYEPHEDGRVYTIRPLRTSGCLLPAVRCNCCLSYTQQQHLFRSVGKKRQWPAGKFGNSIIPMHTTAHALSMKRMPRLLQAAT